MKLWPARSATRHLEVVRKLFGEELPLPLEALLQEKPDAERNYDGEDDCEEQGAGEELDEAAGQGANRLPSAR